MININIKQEHYNNIYGYLDIIENINDDMYYALDDEARKYVLSRYDKSKSELYTYTCDHIIRPYMQDKYIIYVTGGKTSYMHIEHIDIYDGIVKLYGYGFSTCTDEWIYNKHLCFALPISIHGNNICIGDDKYDIITADIYKENIESFIKNLK